MTQDLFNSWFEQALLPELGPGTTIILDNASAHKSPKILDIARSYGCKVLFLPPYSPDLNPIEKFWANLKKAIRSVIRKTTSFQKAITMGYEKPQFGVRSTQFFWLAISFIASARMGSMLYAASAATK